MQHLKELLKVCEHRGHEGRTGEKLECAVWSRHHRPFAQEVRGTAVHRRGWAVAQVGYLGRWKSSIILEYAQEALETMAVNVDKKFGTNDLVKDVDQVDAEMRTAGAQRSRVHAFGTGGQVSHGKETRSRVERVQSELC